MHLGDVGLHLAQTLYRTIHFRQNYRLFAQLLLARMPNKNRLEDKKGRRKRRRRGRSRKEGF
jgi:hypothetical protein